MLRKGTVADLFSGALTRAQGHIVVAMCLYPRGLSKAKRDEYCKALAPDRNLLDAFHAERERLHGDHNAAFLTCGYQRRFTLSVNGVAELKRLAELSAARDVYLVCQCEAGQRCHRELLLILAKRWWQAQTELRTFSYPEFEKRIGDEPGSWLPIA
jgi:uncharacterized protein YeaO (DUF488 family)